MSKPQTAEPSMEDILASIRKMISEERLGPRPIPDQIARSSYGSGAAAPARAGLDPHAPEPAGPAAPDAGTPSFSSLSDALKAATPSAERRSLDEKIADMLEKKGTATAAPTDSLAVFAAHRPALTSTSQPEPRAPDAGGLPKTSPFGTARPQAARPDTGLQGGAPRSGAGPGPGLGNPFQPGARPHGGLNGVGAKPSEPDTVVPLTGETPAGGRDEGQPRPAAVAKSSESERVIAMPSRQSSVSGAGQTGTSSPGGPGLNGSGLNGASVSPLGTRGLNGVSPRPSSVFEADRVSDKVADEVLGRVAERLSPKAPATSPGDEKAAKAPGAVTLPDPEAKGDVAGKASGPAADAGPETKVSHTPSEALIDAVVELVHREPDSLSVFTSGSAFIHGVIGEDDHSEAAPAAGGNPGNLDRSAAELLRPMLRQWLSDNMPRIVEEALRSELMSSQPAPAPAAAPKDTEKKGE